MMILGGALVTVACNHYDLAYPVATCEWCAKGSYTTRKSAKRASRRHHPGRVFNAYRCPVRAELWHYGTLPPGGREQAQRSQGAKLASARP